MAVTSLFSLSIPCVVSSLMSESNIKSVFKVFIAAILWSKLRDPDPALSELQFCAEKDSCKLLTAPAF